MLVCPFPFIVRRYLQYADLYFPSNSLCPDQLGIPSEDDGTLRVLEPSKG